MYLFYHSDSLESFGASTLLLQTTTTTETTNTVEDITKYKYLVFVGLASDTKNSLIIPVDVFIKDTTNNFEFLSANWGAFTEYYARFKVKYVNNTSIKTQIVNKNYVGTLYIYGVK